MKLKKVPTLAVVFAAGLVILVGCGGRPTIEFGAVVPLTGASAVYGMSVERGLTLAYEALSNGSDLGYELKLRIEDSQSDPERAITLIEEIFGDGAFAVVGGVASAEALAMVSVADDQERILLSPSASSPELTNASSSFYRIFPTSRDEAVIMAKFATETLRLEKVTVVTEDSPFGNGTREEFAKVFEGEIEQVVTFSEGDDLAEVARQALDPRPTGIYLTADGPELVQMVRELRGKGFNESEDRLLATTALASLEVIAATQGDANNAYLTMTVFEPGGEEDPMRSFVESFKAKYGEAPDFFAAHGYDALMVLAQAVREAGTVVLPSDVRKGMRAVQNYSGVTGNIQFRENGDVQKFVRMYFIAEGKPVDFEQYIKAWRKDREEKLRRINQRRRDLMRRQQQDG